MIGAGGVCEAGQATAPRTLATLVSNNNNTQYFNTRYYSVNMFVYLYEQSFLAKICPLEMAGESVTVRFMVDIYLALS